MQPKDRFTVPARAAFVVTLVTVSIAALTYGAILISFASPLGKAMGLLLVLAAIAGFTLSMSLATGLPLRRAGGPPDAARHVREERWRTPGIGRSPWGQRVWPMGPLGRKDRGRPRR